MIFQQFVGLSGLKVLAMARLSECEYSVMLYLLNCWASGHDELVTTERELSSLIGYEEKELNDSLFELSKRKILKVKTSEKIATNTNNHSIRICVIKDIEKWELNFDKDVTSKDAIVFPFRRGNNLHIIKGTDTLAGSIAAKKAQPACKRVFESFIEGRALDDRSITEEQESAKILVDTHPVDQILLMIRHLRKRIPTLSLLASSWQHFHEIFERETQKIDIQDARQKQQEMDEYLRECAEIELTKKKDLNFAPEEITVLEILAKHRYPRRQLFWAYQTRGRYPKLKNFFDENCKNMLPITTSGNIIKKKPHWDY